MDNYSRNVWPIFASFNAWRSDEAMLPRRRMIAIAERKPSEEEQARRIQAAAERRKRRNAKHATGK